MASNKSGCLANAQPLRIGGEFWPARAKKFSALFSTRLYLLPLVQEPLAPSSHSVATRSQKTTALTAKIGAEDAIGVLTRSAESQDSRHSQFAIAVGVGVGVGVDVLQAISPI